MGKIIEDVLCGIQVPLVTLSEEERWRTETLRQLLG